MSATYRQSSKVTPELVQRDPENRLLARGPRFRLSAEMMRDQALAVSGLLVDKLGGPSVKPYQPAGLWQELPGGKGYKQDQGEGLYRRSLYTYWKRTVAAAHDDQLRCADARGLRRARDRTNTPLQALNLMNDVTYLEAARKLAERMMREGGRHAEQRHRVRGYELVLARAAEAAERAAPAPRARASFDLLPRRPANRCGAQYLTPGRVAARHDAERAGTGRLHGRGEPHPQPG